MNEGIFEHEPWRGCHYDREGRTAIVGYSHYTDDKNGEVDRASLTNDVVKRVVDGDFGDSPFWWSIASYFRPGADRDSVREFWNSVLFFNFLPQAVGAKMFATGRKAQHELAAERFGRILREYKPNQVFVFSKKAFEALPKMEQELQKKELPRINGDGDQWGSYRLGAHVANVVGLRHPLFAPADRMRDRVQAALADQVF